MLAHFYVSPMTEAETRAIAADWVSSLKDFPAWAIDAAVTEWLRTQERKPTIAGICKLARQHAAIIEFTRQKAMRGPSQSQERRDPPNPDQARRMHELGQAALRRMGDAQ